MASDYLHTGACGGSEYWEHLVREECARQLKIGNPNQVVAPQILQGLLDDFNRKKKALGPAEPQDIILTWTDKDCPGAVTIPKDRLNELWEEAFRHPLEIVKEELSKFAKVTGGRNRVIACGGSCRNLSLRNRLAELCSKESIQAPLFIDNFSARTIRGR